MANDLPTATTYSLESPRNTIRLAMHEIAGHSSAITELARGIEAVDLATMNAIAVPSIENRRALAVAEHSLAQLLEGGTSHG